MFLVSKYLVGFPGNFLILVSNLVPLWSEHTLHNLNLFKFIETVLWPRIRYVLVNIQCALENNVYSTVVG